MRSLFLSTIMLATAVCLYSFKTKSNAKIQIASQSYVQVQPQLYFANTETTNAAYNQYLAALLQQGDITAYNNAKIDTANWITHNGFNNKKIAETYHVADDYKQYPVVNVSYKNAQHYCQWLTETYNADSNRKFKKVKFRLPTEAEWMFAANNGSQLRNYSWNSESLTVANGRFKGQYHANFKRPTDGINTRMYFLGNSLSFYPNELGIYNLSGNAAEMVEEEGIAKGGSYSDEADGIKNSARKTYQSSSPEIGFRVVMEVIEK